MKHHPEPALARGASGHAIEVLHIVRHWLAATHHTSCLNLSAHESWSHARLAGSAAKERVLEGGQGSTGQWCEQYCAADELSETKQTGKP